MDDQRAIELGSGLTPPKRRWYRFSLRTLFLIMTLFACGLGWLIWQLNLIRERQNLRRWIEERENGRVTTVAQVWVGSNGTARAAMAPATIPVWRRWLGDEAVVFIDLPDRVTRQKRERAAACFPEALLIRGPHDYRPGWPRKVLYDRSRHYRPRTARRTSRQHGDLFFPTP